MSAFFENLDVIFPSQVQDLPNDVSRHGRRWPQYGEGRRQDGADMGQTENGNIDYLRLRHG